MTPPSHSRHLSPRYTRLGWLLALGGFATAKQHSVVYALLHLTMQAYSVFCFSLRRGLLYDSTVAQSPPVASVHSARLAPCFGRFRCGKTTLSCLCLATFNYAGDCAFLRPYSLTYPQGKVKEKLDLIGLKFRAVPILTKESREKCTEIRIYHRVIVNKL